MITSQTIFFCIPCTVYCQIRCNKRKRYSSRFMCTPPGDHYTHVGKRRGYDMQDNEAVDWTADGIYSTHLFTDKAIEVLQSHDPAAEPLFLMVTYQAIHSPMEVPAAYLDMCAGVSDVDRQIVCGMTAAMDEGGVGWGDEGRV